MDGSPQIPAASEKQVSKQGKRDLNGPVTLHILPLRASHLFPSPNYIPVDI